jgi:diguanylate cyclase (GGDEF)-like protein
MWPRREVADTLINTFPAAENERRLVRHSVSSNEVARSYKHLAQIYHDLLSLDSLDELLERLVGTVRRLIPVSSVLIVEADTPRRELIPLRADGVWPEDFAEQRLPFGEGLIGLAVRHGKPILTNEAHRDPRAGHVVGTPEEEPEAIISLPLVAHGVVIGAMSLYREGEGNHFSDFEFELAQRFADAATLAIENARTRAELLDQTRRDELTGVLNRRGFYDFLEKVIATSRKGESIGVLVIDLDQFKGVNDRHGHACGDNVLRHVARQLAEATREGDCIGRLGGDEFAIALTATTAEAADAVAARIHAVLTATPLIDEHGAITISASVGAVVSKAAIKESAEAMLRRADKAMYELKHLGPQPMPRLAAVRRHDR